MRTHLLLFPALLCGVLTNLPAIDPGGGANARAAGLLYEMRTYHAAPGKKDAMLVRFRDHACRLFRKHGMTEIGYWTPIEAADGAADTLVYVLAYADRQARERAWKAFMDDPEWKTAFEASERDGKLVEKTEQRFLDPTDFSPAPAPSRAGSSRVFELRTYTAEPDRLPALLARFRDHTCALFRKHGITNVVYWTPAEGEPGADATLVYLLAHPNREEGARAFAAFRADPEWIAVKAASEEKAGGSLTVKDGVRSVLLAPTDFSPMR